MATSFRLEYLILIILCLLYYFYVLKDDKKNRENKKFVKNNLKIGSKIITSSGIIGEVVDMDDFSVLIASGNDKEFSYLKITKDSIEKIIEEVAE